MPQKIKLISAALPSINFALLIIEVRDPQNLKTHKAPPKICSKQQFQILPFFSNLTKQAWYFMRIVCWQTILMKYHTLFFSKNRKYVANLSSAAVVIGVLRVY